MGRTTNWHEMTPDANPPADTVPAEAPAPTVEALASLPAVGAAAPPPLAVAAKPRLRVLLAGPRGFCAGVDRAIKIVEEALIRHGAPVYVRHEIVHNRFVVEQLEAKGAVFVEELDEIPDPTRPVIFSAHGVPKSVPQDARTRQMYFLDATCPLVSKVHREAEKHFSEGRHVLLIGHAGHPEVIGTMGQLPAGAVTLVESVAQAERVVPPPGLLSFTTQTTLSVDDTAEIVAALQRRFPAISGPAREDICYATTNRQAAVKAIAGRSDLIVVVGAANSSNSVRLREVAERAGCPRAVLVPRGRDLDPAFADGLGTVGITAGASAPEVLVEEVLERLRARFEVEVEEVIVAREGVTFKLPTALQS